MAFHFSRMSADGKVVTRRTGGRSVARADYPTGNTCRTCGERFSFSARYRAKLYCSGTCRKAGRLKALRSSGQPYIGPGGYRYVLTAQGWKAEHVLIMERELGRELAGHEHVAHLDGNRAHNEVSNLELRSKKMSMSAPTYEQLARSRRK